MWIQKRSVHASCWQAPHPVMLHLLHFQHCIWPQVTLRAKRRPWSIHFHSITAKCSVITGITVNIKQHKVACSPLQIKKAKQIEEIWIDGTLRGMCRTERLDLCTTAAKKEVNESLTRSHITANHTNPKMSFTFTVKSFSLYWTLVKPLLSQQTCSFVSRVLFLN